MGAEAKRYLQEHSIPQLFEGLMTGLIYNKPEDPIFFLEGAIKQLRKNPNLALKWDSFVEFRPEPALALSKKSDSLDDKQSSDLSEEDDKKSKRRINSTIKPEVTSHTSISPTLSSNSSKRSASQRTKRSNGSPSLKNREIYSNNNQKNNNKRFSPLAKLADEAKISEDAPIILFIGVPGGGKTRYALKIKEELSDKGLVHICMPDLIRQAINKYKNEYPEWKEAAERYQRGELIPNQLAQDLIKAEMGKYPTAAAYFLEGFPREPRQVEDFEKNIRPVNMSMIIDYDEDTLRNHMKSRGFHIDVIERRIQEFKLKTLPSAKYFDDQKLLHLISGEKETSVIVARMRKLILRTMEIHTSKSSSIDIKDNESIQKTSQSNQVIIPEQTTIDDEEHSEASHQLSSSLLLSPVNDESQPKTSQTPKTVKTEVNSPIQQNELVSSTIINNSINERIGFASPTFVDNNNLSTLKKSINNSAKKPPIPAIHLKGLSLISNTLNKSKQNSESLVESSRSIDSKITSESNKINVSDLLEENKQLEQQSLNSTPFELMEEQQQTQENALSLPLDINEFSETENEKVSDVAPLISSNLDKTTQNEETESIKSTKLDQSIEENASDELVDEENASAPDSNKIDIFNRFPKELGKNAHVILIVGPPGSQKSFFAKRIANKYDGFIYLSMGDLFKQKIQQNPNDELWLRIEKKKNSGEIIPMKICRELLYTAVQEAVPCNGFVIEGYPRTLPQAEDIEAQLGHIDVGILIDCTEQYCKDAIKQRFESTNNECDHENVVKVRLKFFKQNTLPMLKYLDDKNKLQVVENDENLENVYQAMIETIDNVINIGIG